MEIDSHTPSTIKQRKARRLQPLGSRTVPKRDRHCTKVVVATAEAPGFRVVRTTGGHRCAVHPSGVKVFFARPRCRRAGLKNARAMLRRAARHAGAGT